MRMLLILILAIPMVAFAGKDDGGTGNGRPDARRGGGVGAPAQTKGADGSKPGSKDKSSGDNHRSVDGGAGTGPS